VRGKRMQEEIQKGGEKHAGRKTEREREYQRKRDE